jgi:glutaredoxin
MEKAKVYLFTSPTCPHCPAAKEFIKEFSKKRTDFDVVFYSTMDSEGQKMAHKFQVMSVPTFIIKGPGNPDYLGIRGGPSENTMNKYLDMSFGNVDSNLKQKKGFFEKMKDGIKIGNVKIKF